MRSSPLATGFTAARALTNSIPDPMRAEHLPRTISPWRGWAPLVALPLAVPLLVPPEWPRWMFMWLLAAAIFTGCKWLTWRRAPVPGAPWWRHAGYLLAWPGLDARALLDAAPLPPDDRPTRREWLGAALKLAAGIILIWGVAPLIPDDLPLLCWRR